MSRSLVTECDWCKRKIADDQPTMALQAIVLGKDAAAETLRKLLGKEQTVQRAGHPIVQMITGHDFFSQFDNGTQIRHRENMSGETWELCPLCASNVLRAVLAIKDAMSPTLSQMAGFGAAGSSPEVAIYNMGDDPYTLPGVDKKDG